MVKKKINDFFSFIHKIIEINLMSIIRHNLEIYIHYTVSLKHTFTIKEIMVERKKA